MKKEKKDMSEHDWREYLVRSYWKYAICALLVLTMFFVAMIVGYSTGPAYEYHNEVLSHVENAEEATTPELILFELEEAEQGMRNLGLTNETYGAFWEWEKTPDRQMSWQYERIHAIQQRARDVISWRENATANGTSIESLGDVYNGKIKHVREEMEDRIDYVAGDAYMVENHLFYYFGFWIAILAIVMFSAYVLMLMVWTATEYHGSGHVHKRAAALYERHHREDEIDEDPPTL